MTYRIGLLLIISSLITSACTSNPFSNNSRTTSSNVAGAAVGGGAGVAASAALGAPRGLVVGAGVGGAMLGYYLTTLRFSAGPIYKAGGDVYAQGEYVGISLPCYKLFDLNSSELLPQAEPILNSAVAVLKRYPNSNILISGNTSGMDSHRRDQILSSARARSVAAYLWAHGINNFKNQSISTRKLDFLGYGSNVPIADAMKAANIQKNNRIQITAYPSPADLRIEPRNTTFTNVGGYDDSPI